MPARRIDQILQGLPEIIARQARQIAELQQAYSEVVHPSLAASSRPGVIHEGRLTLFASNGAVAAKLKQSSPSLLLSLRERGYEVNLIEVRVQVLKSAAPPARSNKKASTINAQALSGLSELAKRLPLSPLRSALERLLANQRRRRPGEKKTR
jgi:hypothetical protein